MRIPAFATSSKSTCVSRHNGGWRTARDWMRRHDWLPRYAANALPRRHRYVGVPASSTQSRTRVPRVPPFVAHRDGSGAQSPGGWHAHTRVRAILVFWTRATPRLDSHAWLAPSAGGSRLASHRHVESANMQTGSTTTGVSRRTIAVPLVERSIHRCSLPRNRELSLPVVGNAPQRLTIVSRL
jgi:hypothetical protein